VAYYRCWSPETVALQQLVALAGRRCSIKESFQTTKPASAWISIGIAAARRGTAGPPRSSPLTRFLAAANTAGTENPAGLISITVNQLRRLFNALILEPARRTADVIT
jgi:hypothetical protein